MRAGALDRRVTFQRATVTYDEFGSEARSWEILATVWANRRDASASEGYRATEVGADISARFTIRYSSDVADLNPRDRAIHNGIVYEITGVREVARHRWLEVDTVARSDLQAETGGSP